MSRACGYQRELRIFQKPVKVGLFIYTRRRRRWSRGTPEIQSHL